LAFRSARVIGIIQLKVFFMNLGVSLGEFIAFISVLVIPAAVIIYIANRFFRLRERKLEIEAMNAAEKAAQYASRTSEIEDRLRVVEQIVTDSGVHTAAQIEALRRPSHVRTNRKNVAAAKDWPTTR
jgi:hypothetical protein